MKCKHCGKLIEKGYSVIIMQHETGKIEVETVHNDCENYHLTQRESEGYKQKDSIIRSEVLICEKTINTSKWWLEPLDEEYTEEELYE